MPTKIEEVDAKPEPFYLAFGGCWKDLSKDKLQTCLQEFGKVCGIQYTGKGGCGVLSVQSEEVAKKILAASPLHIDGSVVDIVRLERTPLKRKL